MDINQLRCFVVLGDELHFGRAARKLEMMPASLSRFIKLLEDDLGDQATESIDPQRVANT